MKEFRATRGLLSAYYVSILLSTQLFKIEAIKEVVVQGQDVISSLLTSLTEVQAQWVTWSSIFLAAFILVFLIKKYLVESIGLYIQDEEGVDSWEMVAFTILVTGSLAFYVNQYFAVAMPEAVPTYVRNFLGDGDWRSVEWLWSIAPIFVLYFVTKRKEAYTAPE